MVGDASERYLSQAIKCLNSCKNWQPASSECKSYSPKVKEEGDFLNGSAFRLFKWIIYTD